jgi:hypothetical protein
MAFVGSKEIILPIGAMIDGVLVREVSISRMSGVDEENMAEKGIRNNGAKAMTVLLRRAIQKIGSLGKKGLNDLFNERLINSLKVPDRDFLFLAIRSLDTDSAIKSILVCPHCGEKHDDETTLDELEVYDWPHEEEPHVVVELKDGFLDEGKTYKEVTWYFLNGYQQEKLARLKESKMVTTMLTMGIRSAKNEAGEELEGINTELVKQLSHRDRALVIEEIRQNTPGVDLSKQTVCDKCDEEWEAEIDLMGFFSSESKPKRSSRSGTKRRKKRVRR